MRNFTKHRLKAFTLNELLVVLIIVGILILLALPSLLPLINRAKATEAKVHLGHIYTLEETYFYEYSKYSNSLDEIGYEAEKSVLEGGSANYRIEIIEASPNGFIARATSLVDFDRDGVYNIWEIDQDKQLKEIVKD